ncbi:HD-GYP domain-containing protein [Geotalea sp. SG265]|uniref:HD-GYP domain-containing protein n=1 Tax=Geotalea sp. SG265 TaxID=2922867 RepID=UPI001FAE9BB7|nr:HD-GYP domain-containing protein [Geotalea sp. SG265]
MGQLIRKYKHLTTSLVVLAVTGVMLFGAISSFSGSARMETAICIAVAMLGLLLMFLHLERISTLRQVEKNWALAGENVRLMEALNEMEDRYGACMKALVSAVDAHDPYASGHSERVASVSVKIGRAMGLAEEQLKSLEKAALFHDVGMLWVPTAILVKEQPLSPDEQAAIRRHTVHGAELLDCVKPLKEESQVVLHHHERFDGTGYPYGLKGHAIPLAARILAVADAFDAMTSERPYRSSLLMREALEELYSNAGGQFDPRVVEAFLNALDDISRENEPSTPAAKRFEARLFSMVGNC